MTQTVTLLIIAAVLAVLSMDDGMESCQQTHSYAVCHGIIKG